jgi:hypothetical protein
MKITVDEKNKAVIASGLCWGVKVTATAVCRAEDVFDKDFGIRLAKEKFNKKCVNRRIVVANAEIRKLLDRIESILKQRDVWNAKSCTADDRIKNILAEKY